LFNAPRGEERPNSVHVCQQGMLSLFAVRIFTTGKYTVTFFIVIIYIACKNNDEWMDGFIDMYKNGWTVDLF
jgi:hypothetical protein